jgi:hypothetical protein
MIGLVSDIAKLQRQVDELRAELAALGTDARLLAKRNFGDDEMKEGKEKRQTKEPPKSPRPGPPGAQRPRDREVKVVVDSEQMPLAGYYGMVFDELNNADAAMTIAELRNRIQKRLDLKKTDESGAE